MNKNQSMGHFAMRVSPQVRSSGWMGGMPATRVILGLDSFCLLGNFGWDFTKPLAAFIEVLMVVSYFDGLDCN